jgi:xanthine/CO dehydrogenase XdhC/CoxF family maturation factor
MSEIDDILCLHDQVSKGKEKFALATVISTDGPSYRSPGARSLITENGIFRGGLSAGCLEGDIACRLDGSVKPFIVEYDLSTEDDIRGFPFGCGGTVEIFVEPLPNVSALNAVQWLSELHEPAVLFTAVKIQELVTIQDNSALIVGARFGITASGVSEFQGGLSFSDVEQLCFAMFDCKKNKVEDVQLNNQLVRIFAEYYEPAIDICLFGDGEDARFLESFATNVGMNVRRFSRQQIRSSTSLLAEIPSLQSAFTIVMTHDLNLDAKVLGQVATAMPPYVGVMGPRARTERICTGLGLECQQLLEHPNLYSPVGLDMTAETPGEIALSILAEIQIVARSRKPGHLRDSVGAIHERGQSPVANLLLNAKCGAEDCMDTESKEPRMDIESTETPVVV